jgi:hypothetical protein
MSSDHYVTMIRRVLAHHEIRTYKFGRSRKHRVVRVTSGDGKIVSITFPSTGSDWRGSRNAAATLRRSLQLRPSIRIRGGPSFRSRIRVSVQRLMPPARARISFEVRIRPSFMNKTLVKSGASPLLDPQNSDLTTKALSAPAELRSRRGCPHRGV